MWEIIRKNKIKSIIAIITQFIFYELTYGNIFFFISMLISPIILGFIFLIPISVSNDTDIKLIKIIADLGYSLIMGIIPPGEHSFFYKSSTTIYLCFHLMVGYIVAFLLCRYKILFTSKQPYKVDEFNLYKTDKSNNPELYNIVEEMTIASGLNTMPKIYILDSNILNAYACGFNPKNSSIVVTKGLLKILTRYELQGVIAHEISHIVNRDTMYLLCAGIPFVIAKSVFNNVGKGELKSVIFLVTILMTIGLIIDNIKSSEANLNFTPICTIAFFVLLLPFITPTILSYSGYLLSRILFMFTSRSREYLADACACQFTRYPYGLAKALIKIEKSVKNQFNSNLSYNENDLIKFSLIVPLFNKNNLFSSHPSTENRIKILTNMQFADYSEYEKEYQKLNHKKLIPDSTLKNTQKINIKPSNDNIIPFTILEACILNNDITDIEQLKIIKENKELIKENIKKNKEIEDSISNLANYITINCECGTKLKIPPIYKNKFIICPHCNKKHVC